VLTCGDLVRVLQDTYLYPDSLQPWYIKKLDEPAYGVVVDTSATDETTVYLEEARWIVNNKHIQLVGKNDVHKSTKSVKR